MRVLSPFHAVITYVLVLTSLLFPGIALTKDINGASFISPDRVSQSESPPFGSAARGAVYVAQALPSEGEDKGDAELVVQPEEVPPHKPDTREELGGDLPQPDSGADGPLLINSEKIDTFAQDKAQGEIKTPNTSASQGASPKEPSPQPDAQAEPPKAKPGAGQKGDEIISLGTEMGITDLVQLVSELTGETFLMDESVKSKKVTIVAPSGGFKRRNALRIFEAILDLNGYSIVHMNGDGVNKIISKRLVKTEGIPTELGTQFDTPADVFVTRIIKLKNLSAADIAATLRPFISNEGDIVAYPSSNTLLIVDRRSNLNRVLTIINNMDVDTSIEFVKIKHMDASEMAEMVVQVFGGGSTVTVPSAQQTSSPAIRAARARERRRGRVGRGRPQAGAGASTVERSYLGFRLITDERTNTLIIAAHPDDLAKIKAIIKKLDVEVAQPEQGIYVIRLKNADAEEMVRTLSNLISGTASGFSGSQTGRRNTLGTGGGATRGGFSSTGGSTLSQRFGSGGSFSGGSFGGGSFIQRQVSSGGGLQSIIAEADGLKITADPATNSIILISSRKDYETIKTVVNKLDVRRKQVFVEAAILEISLDKIRTIGGNLSLGFTVNGNNLGFAGTQLPGVPSLLGISASDQATASLLGGLSGLFLGVVGKQVDPDGSGPIPPIPSFSALFQALTSLTDVNILSTPSLLTTDNEEAEIVVADVIPFPTGSTTGSGGVTVQTINRQPVGIRLSITPQIGEGDYLNLDIVTEVSEIKAAPVSGLNTAEFGIATTTRTADSSVVVKDGQTIIIGGLVQDKHSVVENKVPLLGDVPLLGRLFKFRETSNRKINLMILLTPRIISTEKDMQEILEDRQRRNMLLQQNRL